MLRGSSLPLALRPFTRLAWANLLAQSAEQISLAAVPMIAVLALGAGPAQTGLLAAAQTLPFLLLSMPAGILADRYSRMRLIIAAEALRAAALFALVVLALLGRLSIGALAVIGFLGACGTVAFSVAGPALLPAIVAPEALGTANGRMELARSGAFAAGPALAGALVAWAGAPWALVLATALSVLALLLLRHIHAPARTPAARRHVLRELQEGAAFVAKHSLLRPIALATIAWNLAWFALQAVYVPYGVGVLGLGTQGLGSTLAAFGIGLLAGAVLAPRMFRLLPIGVAMLLGSLLSMLAALLMLATLWLPSGALAGTAFFVLGAGPPLWTVAQITLRQHVTPEGLLGRVSALFMTAGAGARPIGAALGGLVGEGASLKAAIVMSALGFVLQFVMVLASPLPALERMPTPSGDADPP